MSVGTADFSAIDPGAGWTTENTAGVCSIVRDPLAPMSPNNVIEMLYAAGKVGGGGAGAIEYFQGTPGRYIYLAQWFKYSSNWQAHPVANKIIHCYMGAADVNKMYTNGFCSGGGTTAPIKTRLSFQGIQAFPGHFSGGDADVNANLYDPPIRRGMWHYWETIATCNTDGNTDGSVEWWLDGNKCGEYLNTIKYLADGDTVLKFREGWLSATWGGSGSVVAADMTLRTDHLRIELSDTYPTRLPYRGRVRTPTGVFLTGLQAA